MGSWWHRRILRHTQEWIHPFPLATHRVLIRCVCGRIWARG